jgi:hypothetical protein
MSSNKKIYGLYNDDDILTEGAKTLVGKGIHISDVYSPFPIHGIEKVIGMEWTKLAMAAFIYGMIGITLAVLGMNYFLLVDWPMNIGGKPNFSLIENIPSLVPITFEFGVLCAAHGMSITYLLRNWTLPGVKARNPHPRTTDDHFAIEVDPSKNNVSEDEIKAMLMETGPVEVFIK